MQGGTFDCFREGVVSFSRGYFVSKQGFEKRFKTLTFDEVQHFIAHHRLDEFDGGYLGIWKDGDEWCLDISAWYPIWITASIIGRRNKQKVIWDCAAGKEIIL